MKIIRTNAYKRQKGDFFYFNELPKDVYTGKIQEILTISHSIYERELKDTCNPEGFCFIIACWRAQKFKNLMLIRKGECK